MKFSHKIMVGAFCGGLAAWVGDALLDYLFFFEAGFLELLITEVPAHEIYLRLFALALFLGFGWIISFFVNRLAESREKYRNLFSEAPVGIFRSSSEGRFLEANAQLAEIFGCESPEQVLAEYTELAEDLYMLPERRAEFLEKLKTHGRVTDFEVRGKQVDGTPIWFIIEARVSHYNSDGSFVIDGFVKDITERKEARERIQHLNRVITAIRNVNQLIIRENDREELIDEACELLSESGGYYKSLIILQDEGGEPSRAAQADFENDATELLERYQAGELVPCSEEVFEQSSILVSPEGGDYCEACMLRGKYTDSVPAMVKLEYGDRIYGLLTVLIPEEFSQLDEELDLLQEVADDIAFALASIDAREKRLEMDQRLARSRQKLETTLHSIGDGLISTDTEGQVVRMNPVAEELTGWDFEAAEDKPISEVFDIVDTRTGEPVNNPVEEVLASGKTVGLANHTTLVARDGTARQIADSGAPIRGKEGDIKGVVLVFRDITEKYEMQEKIRRSEKRYRSLFNRMNEGVALHEIVHDESGDPVDYKILDVNPQFEEILDLRKETVVEKKATEVYETEEPPYFERYQYVAEEEKTLEFETYYPSRDKHFHISVFSPEPGKFATVFSDISERKEAKAELEKSEQRYRRLFESAQDGMLILDAETGEIKDSNPYIEDILGYSKEELVGKQLWEVGTFRDVVENRGKFEELIETGYVRYEELPLETKAGEEAPVEFVSNTYKAGGERVIQCNIRDISERKQAEEELAERHRQLQTLFSNLPGMAYRCRNDRKWTMEFLSEGVQKLTGYGAKELLGSSEISYGDLIVEADREAVWEEVQNAVEQRKPYELVYRIRTRDDEEKWVWEQGEGVFSETGELKFLEGFITDITERKQAEFKLRESRERFRTILENLSGGVFAHDLDGNIKMVNRTACEQTGYSREELLEMSVADIDPESATRDDQSGLWEKLELGESEVVESTHLRKDGLEYPAEVHLNAIKLAGERIILAIAFDVTDRRRMEKELRESEAKFRGIYEDSPIGIELYDHQGNFLEANEACLEIFGLEESDQLSDFKLFEAPNLPDTAEQQLEQGKTVEYEMDFDFSRVKEQDLYETSRSGIIYVETQITAFEVEAESDLPAYLVQVQEITERKEKEQALRENREFLQQVLETSPVGIIVFDREGKIARVNERALDIFGLTQAEAIGRSYDAENWGFFDEDRDFVPNEELPFARVLRDETTVYDQELGLQQPDGEKIWISVSMAPVFGEDGELIQAVGAFEDITRRREMEAEIREALEEKEVMLQEIHHRVKNNLQVICSLLDMRARTAISEAEKPLIETRNRVNSMALIHDRIYQSETPSAVNIENYLEELIAGLRNTYKREKQEIQVELEVDETIRLELDTAVPCALILNELLANSFEHAFPGEPGENNVVRISCQRNGPDFDYCLRISDNGQGLPEDHEISQLGQQGTLGLGLVKALVEQQLDGQLSFSSTPGEGTEFVVEF